MIMLAYSVKVLVMKYRALVATLLAVSVDTKRFGRVINTMIHVLEVPRANPDLE
jgi:hypothetical protein